MRRANLIYLTYNSASDIPHLPSLVGSAGEELPVIAIDNASSDDSVQQLTDLDLQPKVMDENVGFTAGINIGLRACDSEWAVIANPDVRAATNDWLPQLLDVPPQCGIVGARLSNGMRVLGGGNVTAYQTSVVRPAGHDIPGGRVLVDELLGWTRVTPHVGGPNDFMEPREVPWVPFALAAIRMSMVQEIGLLDETYFHFVSDHEFGLRAWSRGWSVQYLPITFIHDGGAALKTAPTEVSALVREDIIRWCRQESQCLTSSRWL